MTIDFVRASTWGARHGGATRHLVDHGTYAVSPELGPRSRCAGGRYRLELLEADAEGQNKPQHDTTGGNVAASVHHIVRAKRPCKTCAGFAHRFGVNAEEELLPFSWSDERRTAIVEHLSGPAGAQSVHALCEWLQTRGHRGRWETVRHDLFILTGQGRVGKDSARFDALWQAMTNPVDQDDRHTRPGEAADTARASCTVGPSAGEMS